MAIVASNSTAAEPVDFVQDVRPILARHCYSCHGEEKQTSGLRLDVKSEAFRGGELYDAAIVAGSADDSPLVRFVADPDADLPMPPDGQRLSPDEIAVLVEWVESGADWPDGVDEVELEDRSDHWSFKPLTRPAIPAVANRDWSRQPIDRFVLARLEQESLSPSAETKPLDWLRRVSFDLTGLPPTPERVQRFLADPNEQAYRTVVDELLASPRYGERWGQHWLDIVRYADTHGFEVNTERPHAWPYRDYVIAAHNQDLPYDRYVREQIAGDAVGADAATGFLVTASVLLPGQIGKDEPSKRLARQDSLDEIVVNISQTFLGLSIACARCHDHKFDAITQRDYYALQAFVAGVEYGDRPVRTSEWEATRQAAESLRPRLAEINQRLLRFTPLALSGSQRPMVNARENLDRFEPITTDRLRLTILATNNLEPCIDELEVFTTAGENVALAANGTVATASSATTVADRHELRFVNDGRYGNSRSWMSAETGGGWVELRFAEPHQIERVVWGRDRQGKFGDRLAIDYRIEVIDEGGDWRLVSDASDRKAFDPAAAPQSSPPFGPAPDLSPSDAAEAESLEQERTRIEAELSRAASPPLVFAGTFRTPDPIRLLARGDPEQPKAPVPPAVPGVFGDLALSTDAEEQRRRVVLADWITGADHPLTARVMANRIWQGHFGTGLVETASDFGRSGLPPSHPDLLDWLAAEFIRGGWSAKRLHRQIVLSATYRQSTDHDPDAAARDADVRLLWRFPARRLEAEAIRDSMLAISGELSDEMFGRGFDLFDRRGGLTGFNPIESPGPEGLRRMIYAHKVRRERDAIFGAFDCPDGGQSTARREQSTTPIQSLNLFNSRFTLERAEAWAERLRREAGDDVARQISLAFQQTLGRPPADDESASAAAVVHDHGLATLCRVLFNSNEFLFVP